MATAVQNHASCRQDPPDTSRYWPSPVGCTTRFPPPIRDPNSWALCESLWSLVNAESLAPCSVIHASASLSVRRLRSTLGYSSLLLLLATQFTPSRLGREPQTRLESPVTNHPATFATRYCELCVCDRLLGSSQPSESRPLYSRDRPQSVALISDRHKRLLNLAHPASAARQHQPIPSLIPSVEIVSEQLSSLAAAIPVQSHNAHTGVPLVPTAARSEPWGLPDQPPAFIASVAHEDCCQV